VAGEEEVALPLLQEEEARDHQEHGGTPRKDVTRARRHGNLHWLPKNIRHDKPTEGNSAWPYWLEMEEIARAAENYGIAVHAVPEDGTSQVCARHGCEVKMEPRGLVKCPYGRAVHSDVNAALNILRRLEGGCRSASKCSASH
jgi:hypothetical protein